MMKQQQIPKNLATPKHTEGLSEVASMVGRPLSCDDMTLGCKRLDYARLCVEVDATLPFIHTFELELCNETREIHVQYEWKPKRCEKCQVFGHSCLPQGSKIAQPSQKVTEDEPLVTNLGHSSQLSASNGAQPLDTQQLISDAQPTQKVRDDELPDTDSKESEGLDGSYDTEGQIFSDGSDESSSSAETHPSDVRDVRTLPLESPLCTTSKQMSPPSFVEIGSTCWAPITKPSSTVLAAAPFFTNDDKGFTLVTRKKKKKEITTSRAPHTFTTPQRKFVAQAPASSWADRVKVTDAKTRYTLDPIPLQKMGCKIDITEDMLTKHAEQWDRSMVGFFPGYRMNYHSVNTIANHVWKSQGLESVMTTASGFMIFQFQREEQMQEVLERGPWLFGGKAIILQPWHPLFVFDKNRISKLPVWIRLHGLPFSLWSREGLSLVSSMVGRPLSCDEATFNCTRLDFARVCVEIDATQPFVHSFDINTPLSNTPLYIEVEFEWKPLRCAKCQLFGHSCKQAEQEKPKEDA
ncbi:hypothetical protein SADUNF_Sadunf03G0169100 [Salix dunnii]|uniref:DUF4283 domain-containing protein n=1 Tax=Salix dunnii TaxID=1413687 RepID=A0A835N5C3_9ROSI|nr:hypothetical protein SADUNF_Sadunf03G0169100 [Salix dunnii]